MKVFEMAAVVDCGAYYEVEYLTTSLTKDFETNAKFLGLNNLTNNLIQDAMSRNCIVRIVKDYPDLEVMPRDLIIIERDNINSLAFYKNIMTKKARQQVTHQQAVVSGIQMYEYININNYLCDKGYFIHDNNKEDIYLSILETEDEHLIDSLEIYLNARDEIARTSALENAFREYYSNINRSENIDEVDQVYSIFIEKIRVNIN